jgi:hypothetical protein
MTSTPRTCLTGVVPAACDAEASLQHSQPPANVEHRSPIQPAAEASKNSPSGSSKMETTH